MFIVLNTIIKDNELRDLYNFLQIIQDIRPDGLIIQDMGMLNLIVNKTDIVKRKIELHASTQMSTFNIDSINTLKNLGFSRVVLDRHLTLKEIENIKKNTSLEIEVFVHGAMCYSLSGSCYFSSYLGGLSANRGLCAQVCRRNLKFDKKKGYIYSLSDMDTLEILDKIVNSGADALKIEGRMKSADYVYSVTKAYRYLVDNIDDFENSLPYAKDIMSSVVSRNTSKGFYVDKANENVIDAFSSGVYGKIIGRVISQKNKTVKVKLFKDLNAKSRVRLHHPKFDFSSTVKLKTITIKNESYDHAFMNDVINIELKDNNVFEKNNPLYLIEQSLNHKWPSRIRPSVSPSKLKLKEYKTSSSKNKIKEERYYVKLDNYKDIRYFSSLKNKIIILNINEDNIRNLRKYDYKRVYFSLPPSIFEDNLANFKTMFNKLTKNNIKKFEISSISHFEILKNIKNADLISSPTLNIINREGIEFFRWRNFKASSLSFEVSRNILKSLSNYNHLDSVIVPIYGKIRLFVSRAPHSYLNKNDNVYSSRGEKFIFKRENGISETFSDKDYSLTKKLDELKNMGFCNFYIDLSYSSINPKFTSELLRSIKAKKGMQNTTQFNYFLRLK